MFQNGGVKTKLIGFKCTQEEYDFVKRASVEEKLSVSDLLRKLIKIGLEHED